MKSNTAAVNSATLENQEISTRPQEGVADQEFCYSDHDGLWSESRVTGKRHRVCDLYEAHVIGVELVGLAPTYPAGAKGVRIRFAVLQEPDAAQILDPAEAFYPLSFAPGSKLRETVEQILRRPLAPAEVENQTWVNLILRAPCVIGAGFGVEHSTGRRLKCKGVFVFSGGQWSN